MIERKKTDYQKKLLDPRWQRVRLKVLERDGWMCLQCGSKTDTLHVHHAAYRSDAEGPWDYDLNSLYSLCAKCHGDDEWHEWQKDAIYHLVCLLGRLDIRTPGDIEALVEFTEVPLDGVEEPGRVALCQEFYNALISFNDYRESARAGSEVA